MEMTAAALASHVRRNSQRSSSGKTKCWTNSTCGVTGGHALIEGVPGLAKTLAVKSLAHIFRLQFQRVQCTPDLIPADMLGGNIFEQASSSSFRLHRGPIFTDLLLVDEINRMPPRTQSALLEAMEEQQVTIDGTSHPLSAIFRVFATQNPIEFEGTYPLPEAQLDRFLMKIRIGYPEHLRNRKSSPITRRDSTQETSTRGAGSRSRGGLAGGKGRSRTRARGAKALRLHRVDRARDAQFARCKSRSKPARCHFDDAGGQGHGGHRRPRFSYSR